MNEFHGGVMIVESPYQMNEESDKQSLNYKARNKCIYRPFTIQDVVPVLP